MDPINSSSNGSPASHGERNANPDGQCRADQEFAKGLSPVPGARPQVSSSKKAHVQEVRILSADGQWIDRESLKRLGSLSAPEAMISRYLAKGGEQKSHEAITQLAIQKNLIAKGTAKGFYSLLPKGLFLYRAANAIGLELLREAFDTIELKVPPVYASQEDSAVERLTARFSSQDYDRVLPVGSTRANSGAQRCFIRYAADPDLFAFLQNRIKDSESSRSLAILSDGDTARNDEELAGIARTKGFLQPDYHVLSDNSSWERDLVYAHDATMRAMRSLIPNSQGFLAIDVEEQFLIDHPEVVQNISRRAKLPAAVNVLSSRTHYYSLQIQYLQTWVTGHTVQLGNLQLDFQLGTSDWFNISSQRGNEAKGPAVILHGLVTGRDHRVIGAMLNERLIEIEAKENPCFPIDLSPVQARLLFVGKAAVECQATFEKAIRSTRTPLSIQLESGRALNEMVRSASQDWIPLVGVIGDREIQEGKATLTCRRTKRKYEIEISDPGGTLNCIQGLVEGMEDAAFRRAELLRPCNVEPPFRGIVSARAIPSWLR
jgi:hypothetical protein